MQLPPGKSLYFLSDFHLGAPDAASSLLREKKIVRFLKHITQSAHAVFLVGDVFDFWYEYRHVVPKGYVRLLGQLAAMADAGVEVHFTVGNHDMWVKDYFTSYLGIKIHMDDYRLRCNGKDFYVAHGDGLGPGDKGYKFLKKVFRNPVSQWMFGMLPPAMGMGLANYFSRKSRETVHLHEQQFLGAEKEWLMIYSNEVLRENKIDYFIYGHRHMPGIHQLSNNAQYVNLGDWVTHFTYASFDGNELKLEWWQEK